MSLNIYSYESTEKYRVLDKLNHYSPVLKSKISSSEILDSSTRSIKEDFYNLFASGVSVESLRA